MTASSQSHEPPAPGGWSTPAVTRALRGGEVRGVRVWSPSPTVEAVVQAAGEADWRCEVLDTAGYTTKVDIIERCQQSLHLPAYLGRNWDALEEVLGDIDPSPRAGMLVVWSGWADFADADPNGFAVLLSIWRSAARAWAQVVRGSAVTLLTPDAGLTAKLRRELAPLPRIRPS